MENQMSFLEDDPLPKPPARAGLPAPDGSRLPAEIEAAIRWLEYREEYNDADPPPQKPESFDEDWLMGGSSFGGRCNHYLRILLWVQGRDRPSGHDEF